MIRLLGKLIPTRFREPLRVWIAHRFTVPVMKYLDLRADLYDRSELLYQTLEQRLIRNDQHLKDEVARLTHRVAELERRLGGTEPVAAVTADAGGSDEHDATR